MIRGRSCARLTGSLAVVAVIVSVLTACGGGTGSSAPATTQSRLAPFAIDQDFPDPSVLVEGGTAYAYATNSPAANVQFASSTDLRNWKASAADALPELPSWAIKGKTWAPEVVKAPGAGYVMYFTAEDAASMRQCIGVATATTPAGPFTSTDAAPLVCPVDDGGAIDPASFVDSDGARYLVYKNDGNCCGLDTWLTLVRLRADGLAIAGTRVKLVKQTAGWEGNLVEAPTLVRHGSRYVLLYSANDYAGSNYAIGVASSTALTGPYTKEATPVLSTASSGGRYFGPGGQSLFEFGGSWWIAFHSWDENVVYRGMQVARLEWKGDRPSIVTP